MHYWYQMCTYFIFVLIISGKTNRAVARPIIGEGGGGQATALKTNSYVYLLEDSHNVYYVYIKCCKHLNYKFPRVH
jgi:hypothetical protein